MLFYASLFLLCVAISAIVLWFYRSFEGVAKSVYRAFLPSSKDKYGSKRNQEKRVSLNSTLSSAASPWGWSNEGGPRRAMPSKNIVPAKPESTPWGWPGSGGNAESNPNSISGEIAEGAQALREKLDTLQHKKPLASGSRENPPVGWPYREEKFEFAGREYKVTRKRKVKKKNMGGVSKPWGW